MDALTMFGMRIRLPFGNDPSSDSKSADSPEDTVEGHPAIAPPGSLWARQDDVDFFVNPALTLDTLDYISPNGNGPEGAFREAFDLPPEADGGAARASGKEPST
jgi:hypothetical protein